MKKYFEGYYYKHQKGEKTLCLIVGKSTDEEFIQIITEKDSYHVPFIGDNIFSENGVELNINTKDISLVGKIIYKDITPIKYNIMGPFKYFKMECNHEIISMNHNLVGKVTLNNEEIDFTDGFGYIEKDFGTSFPISYVWAQCNHFDEKCSIMVSVAKIPFGLINFRGCICVVHYKEKEYRLATYLGVKIVSCTKDRIILTQGKYKLEIFIKQKEGHELFAPINGNMTRTIIETAACPAIFKFYIKSKLLFDLKSDYTSFEFEN